MSIGRNSLYNLAGATVPGIVALITVPLYLHCIGDARYGILAIVWALLGYFGLFDLGLARATANKIAQLHDAPSRERSEVFWTAALLNLGFGIIGGAAFYLAAGRIFSHWLEMPEALRVEAVAVVPWVAVAVPVATLSGVLTGTLAGMQRFGTLNIIQASGTVLFQVSPLAAAYVAGPTLQVIVPVAVVARVVSALPLAVAIGRTLPLTRHPRFSRGRIRQLFEYGLWVTVTSVVSPILTLFDRLLIGVVLGAKAVAYYTVPSNLVSRIQIVPGALERALFPHFSKIDDVESGLVAVRSIKALAAITSPLIVLVLLTIHPFLVLWVGAGFSNRAAPVAEILLLGIWVNGLAYIPLSKLQGQGRPQVVATFHVLELPPFVVLLWFGLHSLGLVGAAIAWTLRVWMDAALLLWAANLSLDALRPLIPSAALVGISFFWATHIRQPFDLARIYVGLPLLGVTIATSLTMSAPLRNQLRQVMLRHINVLRRN